MPNWTYLHTSPSVTFLMHVHIYLYMWFVGARNKYHYSNEVVDFTYHWMQQAYKYNILQKGKESGEFFAGSWSTEQKGKYSTKILILLHEFHTNHSLKKWKCIFAEKFNWQLILPKSFFSVDFTRKPNSIFLVNV